ncbi:MAG: hypothetical protein ACI9EW_004191, partial [Cellvibrionaceae bacterium]
RNKLPIADELSKIGNWLLNIKKRLPLNDF